LLYAAGFALATALLHGAGMIGGHLGGRWVRVAGVAIAASGLAMVVGV